jgi:hypothetical protein
MQRLTLLLSVLAVGLAGWTAWSATGVSSDVRDVRDEVEALSALDARIAALERRAAPAVAPPSAAAAEKPVVPAALASADGPGSTAPGSPGTPTLDDLAKRVESLEATARAALALGDEVPLGREAGRAGRAGRVAVGGQMPKIYGSVDDAAKDLELTDGQRADLERLAAEARREIDELKKTPDADGKTWEQVQKESFKAEGGVFHLDLGKVEAFREKTIPGRGESFGAAETRIKDQAKRRMRDALTPEQRGKFDQAMVDPMLGSSPGGFAFATTRVEVTADELPLPGR